MFAFESGHGRIQGTKNETLATFTICYDMFVFCFTICLFISPDLDGYRAPKKALTLQDMFHDMFVH